ncbi:MAG: UDP-N-acetylglucosamine 1-carboxyvinyltransferase [Propionibacteriaceae bacterium]|jgi:UDP-N-acetylglucosamine 1-carboxyvinyltransferase|nr:UDP-N-acetylglucosamine 1-carboxyvinyltransferase [Propionibacteriaceae bacterium]
MTEISPVYIGSLIRDARKQRGLTQAALADALGTSQSAVGRIESGNQNLSIEMINRIASALETTVIPTRTTGAMNYRIAGPTTLQGSIATRSSKNAAVSLMCASLLNHGTTVLKGIADIEEVARIVEVLESIGVSATWSQGADEERNLTLRRPMTLDLANMDENAARLTRSIIMFLGPLLHEVRDFTLPYAGGCKLGQRTVQPHLQALRHFGLDVTAHDGCYHCVVTPDSRPKRRIVFTERSDTATENALLAAALQPGVTEIRNASPNYMVQDLCIFLGKLGVQVGGIGTTILVVNGVGHIDVDVEYDISEDPIESMSLLAAGIVTQSELTVQRCPVEFLEIELATLGENMGLDYSTSRDYPSHNGYTRLVDVTVRPSQLHAPQDKIHPMPFPGLNIDNLPFFTVIAATAAGTTLIHDWVYENRTMHYMKLAELGADMQLLDPHRVQITGPTNFRAREMFTPSALRPAVCAMIGMMAAKGVSVLRDVYVIMRGYEALPKRLNALGANIEVFHE